MSVGSQHQKIPAPADPTNGDLEKFRANNQHFTEMLMQMQSTPQFNLVTPSNPTVQTTSRQSEHTQKASQDERENKYLASVAEANTEVSQFNSVMGTITSDKQQ